jgi:UDP-N-acetylmuramoyl-tripeptide--D-alanyl-D-alanine ligase
LNLVNVDSVSFIDDTYNSNPGSLAQALEALAGINTAGRKVFIMGDMLELGSGKESLHRLAGKRIAEVCDALITVGRLTRLTAQAARQAGLDAESVFTCDCSKQARRVLYKRLKPNKDDIVLIKGSRLMQMEKIIG